MSTSERTSTIPLLARLAVAEHLLRLRRFLRAPRVIVGELLAIAAAGIAMTAIPQASDPRALSTFREEYPRLSALAGTLALDRVRSSGWFLALVLCATASLGIVLVEQWRRLVREWQAPLSEASFAGAPYRRVVERAARAGAHAPREAAFRTSGRIGLAGSPLFHLGVMAVALAAVIHLLFHAGADVRLFEGEALRPGPSGFEGRFEGALARPFALGAPLALVKVEPTRYPSGGLERLSAVLEVGEAGARRTVAVGVNEPLRIGTETLYLAQAHGPAALVVLRAAGRTDAKAILLDPDGDEGYSSRTMLSGALELRTRGEPGPGGALPAALLVRVLRSGALLHVGPLAAGETLTLPGGETLTLEGVRYWVQLLGRRDPSVALAYIGFALAIVGVLLLVAFVRVDTAFVVTPTERGERVLVALRAQRFAPLYADRFAALLRAHVGPGEEGRP